MDEPEVIEVDAAPKKKKKRYRRKPKVDRYYLVLIGKRKIACDDAGVAAGVLQYRVDDEWTYMPVTKKVVIRLANPQPRVTNVAPFDRPVAAATPGFAFVDPQPVEPTFEEADLRRSLEFGEGLASSLESMMASPYKLEG